MGCGPDCVDRAVPEGGDGCPVETLPSEPLCVVTDDMTYQEKIEALSGTICMTMMTFVTIGRTILITMTHMTVRSCMVVMVQSDIAGGETIFSRAW